MWRRTSASESLTIGRASARGGSACVKKKPRKGRDLPIRRGIPASQSSIAERMELGKATAIEYLFWRSSRATWKMDWNGENVMTLSKNGCPFHKSASFDGESKVI